jgi:hypothetical protein
LFQQLFIGEEHWESEENEEECGFADGEDGEEPGFNENAFQELFAEAKNISASSGLRLCYQREPHTSMCTLQRAKKRAHELQLAAMDSRPLDAGWLQRAQALAKQKLTPNEEALRDLDKKGFALGGLS